MDRQFIFIKTIKDFVDGEYESICKEDFYEESCNSDAFQSECGWFFTSVTCLERRTSKTKNKNQLENLSRIPCSWRTQSSIK